MYRLYLLQKIEAGETAIREGKVLSLGIKCGVPGIPLLNFERFTIWRLSYFPVNVKLWESPSKAGGLPIIIISHPYKIGSIYTHYVDFIIP